MDTLVTHGMAGVEVGENSMPGMSGDGDGTGVVMEGPRPYRYMVGWRERTIECALWCFPDKSIVVGLVGHRPPASSLGHCHPSRRSTAML